MILGIVMIIIFSYILGSTPYGYLIAKFWRGIDIQEVGSKSIGATNVARLTGIANGILTLFLDMLKGAIPVIIALYVFKSDLVVVLALSAAVCGHIFPVFTKFKTRGKGISTLMGGLLAGPIPFGIFLITGIIWIIVLILSDRRMSLANLAFLSFLLLTLWVLHQSLVIAVFSAGMAGLIWWSHRENVKRIWKGQEPSFKIDFEKISSFFKRFE